MGKVILITCLLEEIWIAQHPDAGVSHLPHMATPFGSNPARLHQASLCCLPKDTKRPLKGDKASAGWSQEDLQLDCYPGNRHKL